MTVVEFGDYQCDQCARFTLQTEPELLRAYVDAGIVRQVWRDYPHYGQASHQAAVAARAAGRQGKFWDFHDRLYADQAPPSRDYLRGVALALGLDLGRFDTDLADPSLHQAVANDLLLAQQLGVPGTPAFLINGTPFFGAQPLAAFQQAIEQAHRQARSPG